MGDSDSVEQPRILRQATAWLGGIAAVLLAAVGVKEAYQKLFPDSPKTPAPAVSAVTPPAASGAAAPAAQAASPGATGAQQPAPPATTTLPQDQPAPPAAPAAPIDLNGVWRDDDGGRFRFEQTGPNYEMTNTAINGAFQMIWRGSISGRDLNHRFEMATGEEGNCTGRINAAGNKITGSCTWPEGGWTFVIER